MASDRYLEFAKFRFSTKWPSWEWKFASATKFDRNRMVRGWDMEIKLFSKWRSSAILNFRKLLLWSCNLCRRVILHILSKFHVNWPKWHRDISGKRFQYRVRLPSWICKIYVCCCCQIPCSEWKFASPCQIWSTSDNSGLRYGDKAIFEMTAVHYLEFAKIAVLVT